LKASEEDVDWIVHFVDDASSLVSFIFRLLDRLV
jgi:hypothetical protein